MQGALAVPLPGQVKNVNEYINSCKTFNFFKPVGLFNPHDINIEEQVSHFKKLKCAAIKVHPRFSNWNWIDGKGLKIFSKFIEQCDNYEMPILFCTYFTSDKKLSVNSDPLYIINELMSKYDKVKLVLLHGGCERFLEYVEYFRYWDQILIDISYTLTRFDGSSVDLDLSYAFKNLDQKISFGSDLPYCQYDIVIKKIIKLAKNSKLDFENQKITNIMYENIKNFLNI